MNRVLTFRAPSEGERIALEQASEPIATYLIIQTSGSGSAYIAEAVLPGISRAELARDLLNWETVARILFIDEQKGICKDASKEIAQTIVANAENSGDTVHYLIADFCERHGVTVPASIRRAA